MDAPLCGDSDSGGDGDNGDGSGVEKVKVQSHENRVRIGVRNVPFGGLDGFANRTSSNISSCTTTPCCPFSPDVATMAVVSSG